MSKAELYNLIFNNFYKLMNHLTKLPLNLLDISLHTSCLINNTHQHILHNFMVAHCMFYILNCKLDMLSNSKMYHQGIDLHNHCQCNIYVKQNKKYNIEIDTIWQLDCHIQYSWMSWCKWYILFDKINTFVVNYS